MFIQFFNSLFSGQRRFFNGPRWNTAEGGEGNQGGGAGQSGTGGGASGGGQGQGGAQSGTGAAHGGAHAGAGAGAAGQESGRQQTFGAEYVSELRNEAATNRRKATEFENKFNETNTKLTETQQKLRTRDVQAKVAELAGELKIASATAATKLLDMSKVKFDAEGNPTNVKELLEELIKVETFLVQPATSTSTSATNPARQGAKFTREQLEKMTTAEINANWDEVSKVLAGG